MAVLVRGGGRGRGWASNVRSEKVRETWFAVTSAGEGVKLCEVSGTARCAFQILGRRYVAILKAKGDGLSWAWQRQVYIETMEFHFEIDLSIPMDKTGEM